MATTMRAGDPEWTTKLHKAFVAALQAAGDDARGVEFSISEEYRDPPSDLAPADGPLGWTCRISDGAVTEFVRRPHPDVDGRVQLDYSLFVELASVVIGGDADKQEWTQQRSASAIADGSLIVTGGFDTSPPWLMATVHDAMARLTDAPTKEDAS
jgi:hypothetical protein